MLHKILKIVGLILCILGGVWLIRIILAGDDAIIGSPDLQSSLVTPYIYIAYVTFAIALVFVIIFVVMNLVSSGAAIKSTAIGVGAFLAVILISYLIAGGEETVTRDGEIITESTSRWVEAGIYAFYILGIIAVGSMIFSSVRKLAK